LQIVKQKQKALEYRSALPEGRLQEYGVESPIATTLHLSVDQIRRDSPLAAEYLFLAACRDRKDILLEFLEAPSLYERDDAIRVINSYKIVTRRPAESALDLHRLVHGALRGWLRKQETLENWTETAVTRLSQVFPDDSHGNRSKWRRMLPHAKYALSHSSRGQEGPEKMRLVWKYAMALGSEGRDRESEELLSQVMEVRKRVLGDEHPSTLNSMANLAPTYRNQGRWKEAEELGVQVMEKRKRVLGDEHPATLTSMVNLASTYWNQGRWKEAEELQAKELGICSRVLGEEHPDTLISITMH
jgi:hypothetical protein